MTLSPIPSWTFLARSAMPSGAIPALSRISSGHDRCRAQATDVRLEQLSPYLATAEPPPPARTARTCCLTWSGEHIRAGGAGMRTTGAIPPETGRP
ncbi:hypothetical protein OG871_36825 [Kitasatospora sp. NBC_00374]|uniref:hypothetical protein n=1 Tax=Kitasatospora sp. NBC_00374 TaxID=2975964 RepID=UPI00324A377E